MADFKIKDISLAEQGKEKIKWASSRMKVLSLLRERGKKKKPFNGITIAACLHVTSETANLMIALKESGAGVYLAPSNPLSTQDDVAAALVKFYEIPVFAIRGENRQSYYENLREVASRKPHITLDDG
ncbi:MAG TPA: adenosylhomocysteinase, partial [candidate division WOR-3 bacterium]|nr:adenosylhomocysteinase [candidate division WOR-3 bacterium]